VSAVIAETFGILTTINCAEDLWIAVVCGVILGLIISVVLASFFLKSNK
jgi:mannitol-specific phosphotransferase system IIBC component